MNRGFYTIMAAQFFSSLADISLLFVAIDLLTTMNSPGWLTPLLKLSFILFYVLLAPFVGAFADSMPKGKVMFISNLIKVAGCLLIFAHVHPLVAYAVVGFGAAVYSPAKYGILTELLPAEKLVAANGWVEGLTVISIILGTVLGGALVGDRISSMLLSIDVPMIDTGINSPVQAALCVVVCIYAVAALFNTRIPDTGCVYGHQESNPAKLISEFANCNSLLWKDKLGQISLGVTTLFWGAAQTLQFIVLEWASRSLHLSYEKSTSLVGVVAIGVAVGAIISARCITLRKSLSVIPVGIGMGVVVMSVTLIDSVALAYPMLILVGLMGGFFLVPMNALLQHRGHVLMSAGHSIAVQNFNENLSILTMLAVYSLLLRAHINLNLIILAFGLFLAGTMLYILRRHLQNQREFDSIALIGEAKH
nr:lysophospholipid transporter LplT [uncultured Duganella sp.]